LNRTPRLEAPDRRDAARGASESLTPGTTGAAWRKGTFTFGLGKLGEAGIASTNRELEKSRGQSQTMPTSRFRLADAGMLAGRHRGYRRAVSPKRRRKAISTEGKTVSTTASGAGQRQFFWKSNGKILVSIDVNRAIGDSRGSRMRRGSPAIAGRPPRGPRSGNRQAFAQGVQLFGIKASELLRRHGDAAARRN